MPESSDNNEALLWSDFLKGNTNALSKIYLNNVNALYDFGCKFTVDKNLVKDCIQEVFVTLLQSGSNLAEVQNVKGYLLKSLKRRVIKEVVKNHKFDEIVERGDYRFEIEYESLNIGEFEDDKYTLKSLAIKNAIESLTNRQKEALYLRFYHGLDHNEVSTILHLTPQSSRALLSRAIQKIREVIETDKKRIYKILFLMFY